MPSPSPKSNFNRKTNSNKVTLGVFAVLVFGFIFFIYYMISSPQYDGIVPTEDLIRFVTPYGQLLVALRPDAAPKTVAHFKKLLDVGFYENCYFYRAEPGFVVQGGAKTLTSWKTSPFDNVPLEYKIPNYRGTLAMARKAESNSGNTEFFFNLADNFHLSPDENSDGYAVFGEVVYGMEVMDEVSVMPTVVSSGMKVLKELVPFNVYYEKDYQKQNNANNS